ncbi:AsmA-like C-terminal region-containing protein [Fulvivirga ligni]|uniref:AsmA-like C-terminal region-containing protein n=1 Tax=Fulvivirga ligni TaxID=2904246 RepID=UPI001F44B0DF|nr:AsmA-like C-terminal region-containing protein [Fulvivirga ligni]UII22578.1 hypothetical protein LVD16_04970 [Fulvivirga ligni]
MKIKRILKKVLIYTVLTIAVVVTSSILATYLYKDQLINHFIREANKSLNTPVHVDKISVSSLNNFPYISLTFNGVFIEESFEGSSYPLLQAEQIDFTFNPIAVFRKDYTVERVYLKKAFVHLKMDAKGNINYNILKETDTTSSSQTVKLDLSKIIIEETSFKYKNDLRNVDLDFNTESLSAHLTAIGRTYDILADGDVTVNHVIVGSTTWAKDKKTQVNANLRYDDGLKDLLIRPSMLKVNESDFALEGTYEFLDKQLISLSVDGKDTDIQTLLSILPESITQDFAKYRSEGDVYFSMVLEGEIAENAATKMSINFGMNDAELYHPDTDVKITHAVLRGSYIVPDLNNINNSVLDLKDINGIIENHRFKSNLYIKNFEKPYVKGDFKGLLDLESIFKFYKSKSIVSGKGQLDADISFEGQVKDLQNKASSGRFKTTGDINLANLSLHLADYPLPLNGVSGNLLFNNNDLALSDVSGKLGHSDFVLNGFFKNIIAYMLFEDEPVGIESDLRSKFIDLDELLAANPTDQQDSKYSFSISQKLVLKFDCDIDHLNFRRFKPQKIKGDLIVRNKIAQSNQIRFNAMGGRITLNGKVDASYNNLLKVNTGFNLNNIDVDSIFYVFENFDQDFLQDKHLKGKIKADVEARMTFNSDLHLYSETLVSNINATIIGGELNNFEPMQRLAKYLDEDKLDHLVFSELRNEIHIENKKIYLPQMEVSSNVTDIKISGIHTFDQNINYRVVAPLRSKRKIDKDEAFGAIEEDDSGRTMLYLKIIGNTSDYQVLYDKESVKKKVISDIKKEATELKNAFKNKGKEKKETIELQEDDYFDWDN